MGTPVIELLPEEIAWTDNASRKEHDRAIAAKAAPRAGAFADQDEALAVRILGNRCEAAAYKWAKPVDWRIILPWKRRQPDLDNFIDVKGVPKSTYNLPVKPDDPSEWAYLLVDGSAHPFYDIVGWSWGYEAQSLPLQERKLGIRTHFVDRDNPLLRDPRGLLLVLRERQQFPERSLRGMSPHGSAKQHLGT